MTGSSLFLRAGPQSRSEGRPRDQNFMIAPGFNKLSARRGARCPLPGRVCAAATSWVATGVELPPQLRPGVLSLPSGLLGGPHTSPPPPGHYRPGPVPVGPPPEFRTNAATPPAA